MLRSSIKYTTNLKTFSKSTIKCYSTEVSEENLLKTPLFDSHVALGATMVPFAGYSMPVLYKDQTHIQSHNWTRKNCGIFDVSHMLQHKINGPNTTKFLEKITPTDFHALKPYQNHLSVLLNKNGGVIDDTIITKHADDSFYIVTNAGCREKDIAFIKEELKNFPGGEQINHENFDGTLLAIQGPKSQEILSKFTTSNLKDLYFGNSRFIDLQGFNTDEKFHVSRGGYTGEDGFEISIPNNKVGVEFFNALLEYDEIVKPIGLAARDSLRLEAGMCLYGHELNDDVTPIEASLNWLVSKSRRGDSSTANFNGASKIIEQINNPKSVSYKRVGLTSKGPSPRHGNKIFSAEDPSKQVGIVCSGSPSPSAGGNVAQVFLDKPYNKTGTKVKVEIRGKLRDAEVAKMPFYPTSYYKSP
ncbi:Aminomethyltransferase, mitochondrial [Pichia californica]|uniref:Aminomethyltransferase n=1 Tax=Pichia californica TaxID=460514 RepID=A0A9P7BH09_9ASCO|nr:Aminomethyltransferase, mitochondrial [[Candida] californica]KAG0689900.1 Aminomethyltransferase, mitochondrial [[Candida] californica]